MMDKGRVTCALPTDVHRRIQEFAQQEGVSIGRAVGLLLQQLEQGQPAPPSHELEARITRLEEAVRRVAARVALNGGGDR